MGGGVPVCHAGGGGRVCAVLVRSGAWATGMRPGVKVGSRMCSCGLIAGLGELLWEDVGL